MSVTRIFRSQLLSLLMLTMGLTLLVGIGKAADVQASGASCTSPVTDSVYVSVYGIGSDPNSVTCVAGSSVVLSSVYAKYDITLHVPAVNNGKPALMVQNGTVSSQSITGESATFTNVSFAEGDKLHFGVLPHASAVGVFYKRTEDTDEILFKEGFWSNKEFNVEELETKFDIYVSEADYEKLEVVDSSNISRGSSHFSGNGAFVPNVPIDLGKRAYALLSNGNKVEDAYMVGHNPDLYYEIFKIIAKDAVLEYYTNNDDLYIEVFPGESTEPPLEDYVMEQPANNVIFYYSYIENYPLVTMKVGVDERIITAYDNDTIIAPEDIYSLTLTKAMADMNQSLAFQPVYVIDEEPGEGGPMLSETTYLSDSQGRVTFLGAMETELEMTPPFFYWPAGVPLLFKHMTAGPVVLGPGSRDATLPVMQFRRPESTSPIFELQDLVWIAKNAHVLKDRDNAPLDISNVLFLLVPDEFPGD